MVPGRFVACVPLQFLRGILGWFCKSIASCSCRAHCIPEHDNVCKALPRSRPALSNYHCQLRSRACRIVVCSRGCYCFRNYLVCPAAWVVVVARCSFRVAFNRRFTGLGAQAISVWGLQKMESQFQKIPRPVQISTVSTKIRMAHHWKNFAASFLSPHARD